MNNISISENIAIKTQSQIDLRVDIYDGISPETIIKKNILLFPGGSWFTSNYKPLVERFAIPLAKLGYRCITAQYRVAKESTWPGQLQDVSAILEWLDKTQYTSDFGNNRVLIAGKSAGGHLALMSPLVNEMSENLPTIAGVIGLAPVIDIGAALTRDDIAKILGPKPSEKYIRNASPLEHVTLKYPPTLLIHGTSDDRVHHAPTLDMYQRLEKLGVPADLLLLAGKDHSFDSEPEISRLMVSVIDLFISRYIC